MISVAVVGCGYWGPNLIRNLSTCRDVRLVALCDANAQRLNKLAQRYPGCDAVTRFDDLLSRSDLDAIALATPVDTHAPLGLAALEAGKHLLVEKPLASSIHDAKKMVQTASERGLTLMVDHTYLFSEPVRMMKRLVDQGELGDIYFIDSVRINLGLFQHDVNVVWDLAPHDLSILDYIVSRLPKSVSAFGGSHADNNGQIEDVAYLNLDFGDKLLASMHVNWLSPVKIRHFIIGGSKKSLVYNDLEPTEKLKIYDRGITVAANAEAQRGMLVGYRTGDVWSPHIEWVEPLEQAVRHFVDCVQNGSRPICDGEAGLRVVQILEAAQRSIKAQGGRIVL